MSFLIRLWVYIHRILMFNYAGVCCLGLLLWFEAGQSMADEVSGLQYKVSEAQRAYQLAKTRYQDASQLVNEQKERLAQDQAILKERQKKQTEAQAAMFKAKAKLDSEEGKLGRAWNGSHH